MLATSSTSQECRLLVGKRTCVRPRVYRRNVQPRAMLGSSYETIKVASQLLSTAAVGVGAWYFLMQNGSLVQDNIERSEQPACPRCNGSGYESCVCNKWSDDDVGCNSCSKTGYMRCRSCGGGGTAVPLLSTVRRGPPSL